MKSVVDDFSSVSGLHDANLPFRHALVGRALLIKRVLQRPRRSRIGVLGVILIARMDRAHAAWSAGGGQVVPRTRLSSADHASPVTIPRRSVSRAFSA